MKKLDSSWIPALLTAAVLVLLNVASTTLFFRVDLTRNQAFSLSNISKQAVSSLEEPLTIKVFLSKNLPAPYNNTEQVLRDLLEEYSIAGNRFFNYSIISMPSKEELANGRGIDQEEEARKYRIFPIQIQNVEQDEVKLQTAYMGVTFIHGDVIETIPALTATDNLEYRITSIIRDMGSKISTLLSMEGRIDITLYLSGNMDELGSSITSLPSTLSTAVDELNAQYYGKLSFNRIDPLISGDEEILRTTYRIDPLTLTRRTENGEEKEQAYAALVVTYGDDYYAQNLVSRGIFGMQISDAESLRATIEDVTEAIIGVDEEIGYVTGYGISTLDGQSTSRAPIEPVKPDMRNFDALISSEYSLREIDLSAEEIPEGIGCLIVAGPTEQLSDYDLFKIDQFLMKGGSLALFLDSHSIYLPQQSQFGQNQEPAYIPRITGLEDVLSHYGVDLQKAFVLDEESFKQQQRGANGGIVETTYYFAPIISDDRIEKTLPFMRNIPELIMLYPSALNLNDSLSSSVDAYKLFSSSEDSWTVSENINLVYPQLIQPPPDDVQRSVPLAYILEGTFTSFFSGLPAPEPEVQESPSEDEQSGTVVATDGLQVSQDVIESGEGRILVIGTSALLGSNILQADAGTGNALFMLNVFDYLSGNEDNAVMRAKGVSYVPLEDTTPQLRTFIKTVNIAVIPALVIIAGIGVWLGRMSRRRQIEAEFLKTQSASPEQTDGAEHV